MILLVVIPNLVGEPVVGCYASNGVVMGLIPSPARLVWASSKITSSQVVVQLRGMYPTIGATLKSENGKVVVRT